MKNSVGNSRPLIKYVAKKEKNQKPSHSCRFEIISSLERDLPVVGLVVVLTFLLIEDLSYRRTHAGVGSHKLQNKTPTSSLPLELANPELRQTRIEVARKIG